MRERESQKLELELDEEEEEDEDLSERCCAAPRGPKSSPGRNADARAG